MADAPVKCCKVTQADTRVPFGESDAACLGNHIPYLTKYLWKFGTWTCNVQMCEQLTLISSLLSILCYKMHINQVSEHLLLLLSATGTAESWKEYGFGTHRLALITVLSFYVNLRNFSKFPHLQSEGPIYFTTFFFDEWNEIKEVKVAHRVAQ